MFQGPTGYKAQICEVQLQYGNSCSITKWPVYTFSSKFPSNIYSIIFDCTACSLIESKPGT